MYKIIKENSRKIMFLIIFALILSIPYLNNKIIFAHDISYHINRIINVAEELRLGNFPVLIHSKLSNGFGYANSLFYPELFIYIPAILKLLGANTLFSYKFFIMIINLATICITYYSAYKIFKNKKTAISVSIIYSTAYYRLVDTYVRGALGEVLAMAFLPLIICGIYEIIFGENRKWWIICFGIFGIINSHVLSFAMAVCLILFFCVINCFRILKDKKRIFNLIIAGVISILLTLSFVLPYLEQSQNDEYNVDLKIYSPEFLQESTCDFKQLFKNNINSDSSYKSIGIILPVLSLFILLKRNKEKVEEITYIKQIFILGILLLTITTSYFPWAKLCTKFPIITTMQFVFRLNIFITLLLSFVAGYIVSDFLEKKPKIYYAVNGLIIVYAVILLCTVNINTMNMKDIDELVKFAPTGNSEYLPTGTDFDDKIVRNIANNKSIEFTKTDSKIEFYYNNTEDPMVIHIPLVYYKGYNAYIEEENGSRTDLIITENEYNKNVMLNSEKILTGKITVEYKMTTIQKIGYAITYFIMVGLIIYIEVNKRKDLKEITSGNTSIKK